MSDLNQAELLPQKKRSWPTRLGYSDSYGFVLLLLLVSFILANSGIDVAWMRVVTSIVQGITLVVALRASHVRQRTLMAGIVSAVLGIIIILSLWIASIHRFLGLSRLIGALLIAATAIAIIHRILRYLVINRQTILGALCVYILIGMFFAYFDAFIGTLLPSFFVSVNNANLEDYQYFSFITLTTVGYGDLVPHGDLPRTLAVIEALFGQIYLVTFVALIVGNFGRTRTPGTK